MAQENSDLPEGTDEVIEGAMETDTSVTTSSSGRSRGSRGGSRASASTGNAIMEKVRSGSDKLSEQAADKARGFVGQGIERSAEALANVGKLSATPPAASMSGSARNMAIMRAAPPKPSKTPPTGWPQRIPTS